MPERFGCPCLPLVRELGAAGRHGVTGAALRSAGLARRSERLPRRIETAPAKRKRYGPERARPEPLHHAGAVRLPLPALGAGAGSGGPSWRDRLGPALRWPRPASGTAAPAHRDGPGVSLNIYNIF